jgi:Cu-processing system permease protein
MNKILRYEIHNTIRNKWIIVYAFFFFFVGYAMFAFSGDASKAYISLMNVVLIIIPIVSLIFGSIYLYNSREFVEMMLSQPIDRKSLFLGVYFGTSIPLSLSWVIGIILPFLLFSKSYQQFDGLLFLILIGAALTFVFTAIAFLVTIRQDDKAKGLGYLIMIWLLLAVIYDGIILLIVYYFQNYPLEKVMIGLSIANPIDLARLILLIKFNISALMGYTGAVFQNFFGSVLGIFISIFFLFVWIIVPIFLSTNSFSKKDF